MAALPGQAPNAAAVPNEEAGNLPALTESAEVDLAAADLADDPVLRLRRLIEEREDETVEILRSWMEEDENA